MKPHPVQHPLAPSYSRLRTPLFPLINEMLWPGVIQDVMSFFCRRQGVGESDLPLTGCMLLSKLLTMPQFPHLRNGDKVPFRAVAWCKWQVRIWCLVQSNVLWMMVCIRSLPAVLVGGN